MTVISEEAKASKQSHHITRGAIILIVLHSPREKCWGVLDGINQSGVYLRGIDLSGFDDLLRSVGNDEETFTGLSETFFPMWRVERITRDARSGEVPALYELYESRTGKPVEQLFAADIAESVPENVSDNPS